MYQVNKLFLKQNLVRQIFRTIHRRNPVKALYPLTNRCLLNISGNDAPVFLQGLITNDMNHFEEGAKSMYAMFLNNKGRVLYDTLIHKWEGSDSFLLECDRNVNSLIQKHLKTYKLKRNVEITDASADFRLFALVSPEAEIEIESTINPENKVNVYKDPRLTELGHRIIASKKADDSDIEKSVGDDVIPANNDDGYRYLRYKLGVSEGSDELAPGTCFPLEANCDYLHGVSFHKGCYIGQEVTARVHHTGVVRKRIMPLQFEGIFEEDIEKDAPIIIDDAKNTKIGKLKSYFNDYAIGLVRVKEALEANNLKIGPYTLKAVKPSWWPIEAPKEKAAKIE